MLMEAITEELAANEETEAENTKRIHTTQDKEDFRWPMWPKIIQVNATDVYVIGGNNLSVENQDNWNFIVQKLNIQINTKTHKVTRKADMCVARQA